MTTQFQVGRTYSTRSIGDHDVIYSFEILKRTAKSVTVKVYDKVVRRGLYIHNGVECFKPFGTYSMCAIISAGDRYEKPGSKEDTAGFHKFAANVRGSLADDDVNNDRTQDAEATDNELEAMREHVVKVDVAEALALAEAAQAMLKALKAVYGCPQAAPYLTRGPAHGVDAWLMVRHAIAQAEAAGITATEAED